MLCVRWLLRLLHFVDTVPSGMVALAPNHNSCGGPARAMCAASNARGVMVVYDRGGTTPLSIVVPGVGNWSVACFNPVTAVFSNATGLSNSRIAATTSQLAGQLWSVTCPKAAAADDAVVRVLRV